MSRTLNNLASGVVYDIIDGAIKCGRVHEILSWIDTNTYGIDAVEKEVCKIAESITSFAASDDVTNASKPISGKGKSIRLNSFSESIEPMTPEEMHDELLDLRSSMDMKNRKLESLENQIRLLRAALKNQFVASSAASSLICELWDIKLP